MWDVGCGRDERRGNMYSRVRFGLTGKNWLKYFVEDKEEEEVET
jgi:hypothetical protein